MVKTVQLNVQKREESNGKAKDMRDSGFIPGVLYGSGIENINLKVKKIDLDRIYSHGNDSGLIDLEIDGKETVKAIVKDTQRNFLNNGLIHIDFYKVDMNKPIEVEIHLDFINESKAVKELGGTLIKNIESVHARCLPGDLVEKIDVDLSVLETFEDHVQIRDLVLPKGIEVINNQTDAVANVIEPRAVEEEVVAEEAVEKEGEEKKEAAGAESKKE